MNESEKELLNGFLNDLYEIYESEDISLEETPEHLALVIAATANGQDNYVVDDGKIIITKATVLSHLHDKILQGTDHEGDIP